MPPVQHPLVVKLGGEVIRGGAMPALSCDLAAIAEERPLVVVHGAGAQATELGERLSVATHKVSGLRVTDDAMLEVVKMAVSATNVDVCAALVAAGARPVGLTGASSRAVGAERRAPLLVGDGAAVDLGHVGDVVSVNVGLFRTLVDAGFVPVVACLGADADGRLYNINADTVAANVARQLEAEALVLVSDVPGVLRDLADASSRIPRMTREDARKDIASGAISHGMAVKLAEAFAALDAGVPRVHIAGRLSAGDLVREMREPGSCGTVLAP